MVGDGIVLGLLNRWWWPVGPAPGRPGQEDTARRGWGRGLCRDSAWSPRAHTGKAPEGTLPGGGG